MNQHSPGRARRWVAGFGAAALTITGLGLSAAPAQAASVEITDAEFAWSINEESGGGAFLPGTCNFLTAGAAGDAGSARVWTEAGGFYSTEEGNVSIRKPDADGGYDTPTWSTKCQDANGTTVGTGVGSSSHNEAVFANGSGSVDLDANIAEIQWDGSFTIVFYGGFTYWTVSDPQLSVNADGTGELTGTASGYGTSMEDMSQWVELDATEIQLATFDSVEIGPDGVEVQPHYAGVEVEVSPDQNRTNSGWGAFPQSWVDFNVQTGQSSYWYSSGGAADPKKPAAPFSVAWTPIEEDDAPGNGDEDPELTDNDVEVGVSIPQSEDDDDDDDDDGEPGGPGEPGDPDPVFRWELEGNSVSLGTASELSSGAYAANGQLPTVTVTDTRPNSSGWSVAASATEFSATSGSSSFGAAALGWVPSVTGAGNVQVGAEVLPNTDGGLSSSKTLASSTGSHESPVTAGAELNLTAPGDASSGDYRSVLTLTAISK